MGSVFQFLVVSVMFVTLASFAQAAPRQNVYQLLEALKNIGMFTAGG
jgi:hypothetical protein